MIQHSPNKVILGLFHNSTRDVLEIDDEPKCVPMIPGIFVCFWIENARNSRYKKRILQMRQSSFTVCQIEETRYAHLDASLFCLYVIS